MSGSFDGPAGAAPSPGPMADRTLQGRPDLASLAFGADGLIPVVAQDAETGGVLMVAWANMDALERTLDTGRMHYWSRSRDELWEKGATSGNVQAVRSLHADCDGDTVLARVASAGPACHTGDLTCFGAGSLPEPGRGLARLWDTLVQRAETRPEGSYTTLLLADENLRLKKLGEETAELIHALATASPDRIPQEAADLLYHVMVALLGAGSSLSEVLDVLQDRRNPLPGHG